MSTNVVLSHMAAYVLVSEVLEQLELTVGSLGKDGCAEGLHDFLDGDILVGELIARGAVVCQSVPTRAILANGIDSPDETKSSHAHRLQVRVSVLQISRCSSAIALIAHSTYGVAPTSM